MDLLKYKVRQDWRSIDASSKQESQKIWRFIVLLVSLLTLFVFITSFLFYPTAAIWGVIRTIVVPVVYLVTSIFLAFKLHRSRSNQNQLTIKTILGFRSQNPVQDFMIGVLAGSILGFNIMLLALFVIPTGSLSFFQPLRPPLVTTAIILQLVLVAFGEEVLLRGVGYYCLYEKGEETLPRTILFLALLQLLMYVVQIAKFIGTSFPVYLALYRFGFGLLATLLRYHRDSTITSLLANFAFNVVLVMIIPW